MMIFVIGPFAILGKRNLAYHVSGKLTFFVKNFLNFWSLKSYAQSIALIDVYYSSDSCSALGKKKAKFLFYSGFAHEQSLQPPPRHRPIQC